MPVLRAFSLLVLAGTLLLFLAIIGGCAMKLPLLPSPPATEAIVFTEAAPASMQLCVPAVAGLGRPLTCLTLGELRQFLRGRRFAMR